VEAARRRLKVLEGEYRLIHREMAEAVEEAGAFAFVFAGVVIVYGVMLYVCQLC
jgi:hypothetical protein